MKFYRWIAVTKRVLRDLKNDRRTIALMFVAPLFAMFVFGLAFSGDVKNVSVIVVNEDKGIAAQRAVMMSEEIVENMNTETLTITRMDNVEDARKLIENGESYAVIVFPEHFTRNIAEGVTILVILDKSNVNVANAVMKTVNTAVLVTMQEEGKKVPITVVEDPLYGENAEFIDYFFPGILSFVAYLLTVLLTLVSFVSERVSGTLDRLLATPLRESEIVTGYAVAFGIMGTVQSAFLLAVGTVVFGVNVVGNVLLAFIVIALLAVVSQALGILLSALAWREVQAIQFFPFVVLPAFLLSGVFWPVEAIPSWLRPASYLVPTTYAVDACRDVMLRGWGLGKVWPDIAALVMFAGVFLVAAMWSLKRKR
jgi:ABC-2 type transport system permease protein